MPFTAKFRGVDKKVYFPPVEPLCCKLNLLRTHVRDLATPAKPAALLAKLVMQDWAAVLTDGQRDAVAKDGSYKAARQIEGLCELMDLFYDPQKVTLGISPDGHHLLDEAVAEARAFAALFVFEKPGRCWRLKLCIYFYCSCVVKCVALIFSISATHCRQCRCLYCEW